MDPFWVAPLKKAYYHPTPNHLLNNQQKQVGLASDRQKEEIMESRSAREDPFVLQSHSYIGGAISADHPDYKDTSSKFNESWPDSERPSTANLADFAGTPSFLDENQPVLHSFLREAGTTPSTMAAQMGDQEGKRPLDDISTYAKELSQDSNTGKTNAKTKNESVLSRYIERFRHGEPLSRKERQQEAKTKEDDFWWLKSQPNNTIPDHSANSQASEHPLSLTPKDLTPPSQRSISFSSYSGNNDRKEMTKSSDRRIQSTTSRSSSNNPLANGPWPFAVEDDAHIAKLQRRAEELLEKTASSSSRDLAVSTDGLGSSTTTAVPSTIDELPHRPDFIRFYKGESFADDIPAVGDDILSRWRRQRKVEVAKQRLTVESSAPRLPDKTRRDVDSKLEEFRQRLACQRSTVRTVHHSADPVFTPAPMVPSHHIGRGPEKHLADSRRPLDNHHNPDQRQTKNDNMRHDNLSHYIASPHLQHPHSPESVRPHHHLACDIVPCVHSDNVLLCPHNHAKQHRCSKQNNGKVNDSPTPDSSFEKMKARHMEGVAREISSRRESCSEDYCCEHPVRDSPRNDRVRGGNNSCVRSKDEYSDIKGRARRNRTCDTAGEKGHQACENHRQSKPIERETRQNHRQSKPFDRETRQKRGNAEKMDNLGSQDSRETKKHDQHCEIQHKTCYQKSKNHENREHIPLSPNNEESDKSDCEPCRCEDVSLKENNTSTDHAQDNSALRSGVASKNRKIIYPDQKHPGEENVKVHEKTVGSDKETGDRATGRKRKEQVKQTQEVDEESADGVSSKKQSYPQTILPPPRSQSSPKPQRTVRSAVGQVVQHHLFSSVSPMSSVEKTVISTEILPNYHDHTDSWQIISPDYETKDSPVYSSARDNEADLPVSRTSVKQHLGNLTSDDDVFHFSDEEEFHDDDLLQELRARRKTHLFRLQKIGKELQVHHD